MTEKEKIKLREFKAKYISLIYNNAKNEREKELASMLIVKLHNLRCYTLSDLAFTLYLIIDKESSVSEEFKEVCRKALNDILNIFQFILC